MRILFFITLCFISILTPWYITFLFAAVYAFLYFGPELVVAALCIDAYFGSTLLPYYTLVAAALVIGFEYYKEVSYFHYR